jgi:opacity protein-like surface antigen
VKRTIIVKVLYVVLPILVMMPEALWAQAKKTPLTLQKPYYGVLKLGEYLPQSGDLSNQNAGNGFAGQVAFGYYPIPYFAVEAGVGYFESKGSVSNVDRKFSAWPLEVSGRLALPISFLEPYLLAGVGAYFTRAEVGNLGRDSIQFGYFGGGGLNFNLGKSYFIGAEARYLVLKIPIFTPVPTPYGTTTYESSINFDGVMVTGNIGFRW